MTAGAIALQAVCCVAAERTLLDIASLHIGHGERVAIVGHNGAGKSTLLRLLNGFMPATLGSVQVLGHDLSQRLPTAELRRLRRQVGQIHQGLHLVGRLTALENVLIGSLGRIGGWRSWLRCFPADEVARADAALHAVGLLARAATRADRLSGGERQKVAIARLLLQRPALILADEPTAALDPAAASEVCHLLAQAAAGATLITVVHNPTLLPVLAERVIGLKQGRVAFDLPVAAVDDLTLEVTLSYPYSEFPAVCAHPALAPVSQEAFETAAGHFGGQPAGTGRFRLASWERGTQLVLEKNPEYAGASPSHLDGVTFVIYADAAAAYAAFTAGEVQEAPLPASERENARAVRPDELYEYPLLGTYLLGFNMRAEPWRDSRELRQALNYGIDRAAIAAALTDESWEPAGNILPPGMAGGGGAPYYTEDLDRARGLLAQAGYSEGSGLPPLDLAYLDNASNRKVADEVRDQLARIDINVVPRALASSEYATLILTQQLSFFRFSWQARYPNGDDVLYPLFYSGNAGSDNLTQYASDEVDGLLEEARRRSDERARLELLQQAEVRILEDSPVIPLLYQRAARMVATTLGGYARTPLDYTRYELLFLR
ncbi:MAG: hypothetical protein CVU18_04025 [Betaproteobacteria bacterium HGW-Betaproteobacteria-12]|nr:MAG: hypothetical protein CVU18_04025 [Betaproteobacteria bacterium HGW-Betaproteobacteria-12]